MAQYESNHRVQLSSPGTGNADLDSRRRVGGDRLLVGIGHCWHVPVLGVITGSEWQGEGECRAATRPVGRRHE